MKLWIRSQDKKKLIKVNEIKIESVKDGNSFIYSDITDLGTYKTKERAKEILDEIQKIIHLKDMYINDRQEVLKAWTKLTDEQIADIRTKMSVYEMPEE